MATLEEQVAQKKRADALLEQTRQQYPFIDNVTPIVSYNPGGSTEYRSETWRVGDEGTPERPRPKQFPMDRVGVEVYNPDKFGPSDLAGEMLHVDPRANAAQQSMMKLFTPEQWKILSHASGDYGDPNAKDFNLEHARSNAMDSAMRGYTVDQWTPADNAELGYTPEELQVMDSLKQYMKRGY